MTARTLREPSREVPVFGTFDVVVLGGGPAGIAAATASARAGASTLLVERYGFLGGMGTAAGVTNFCGLFANRFGSIDQVVHGVADDLLARIDALGGLKAPHTVFGKIKAQAYDTAAYKIAADAMLLASGARILFHALAAGVVMDGSEIMAMMIETKSGRRAVQARVFIDGSGDGDLAAWAGAPVEIGTGSGALMYPSTMFRINDVPRELAARSRLGRLPCAHGSGRGAVRPALPAQDPHHPAAEPRDRVAGEPDAGRQPGRERR